MSATLQAPAPTITYPVGFAKAIIVITAISCALLELIDATIVNVSLREIAGSIGATTTEIAWVVTAYAVSNVIMIPLASMFSDMFGRRNYFVASIIIFTVSSLMCGLSGSLWTLVLWRFIQGIGGGGLLSTAQTIIIGAFPPEKINTANAIFGMGFILGPTFGPSLGGLITDNFSWHWIFFVNVPIGISAALLSLRFVTDRPGAQKPRKIDWWGIIFLVLSVGSIQYVLEEGTSKDWFQSEEITLVFILAILALLAFIHRELSIDYPAVNIRLYRNYNLAVASVINLILGMLLFGSVFIFPLFVQISLGWTATQTGVFFIPGALLAGFSFPVIGKLLEKGTNPKRIILVGVLLTFGFLLLLAFSSPDSNANNYYLPFFMRGIGLTCMLSPILSLAVGGLKGKDLAQAVGLANMIRQLGGAFGIALINVFLTQTNAQVRGNMIGNINIYDTVSADRIAAITQSFQAAGRSLDEAQLLAFKSLEGAVFRQQALVSYDQGFLIVAMATLLTIPVVLMLRHKKAEKAVVPADH